MQGVDITSYDGSAPPGVWAGVTDLYVRVFSGPPYGEDPADLGEIAQWGPRRLALEGGRLVVARAGDRVVGCALGYRLSEDAGTWHDTLRRALTPVEAVVLVDHADRVYSVRELAVDPALQQQGLGRACLRALLADRPEERVVLGTFEEARAARNAYARWGFDEVGYTDIRDGDVTLLVLSRELPWI